MTLYLWVPEEGVFFCPWVAALWEPLAESQEHHRTKAQMVRQE
jgi:hypothetical protein